MDLVTLSAPWEAEEKTDVVDAELLPTRLGA
jgi:hypothetical protein